MAPDDFNICDILAGRIYGDEEKEEKTFCVKQKSDAGKACTDGDPIPP